VVLQEHSSSDIPARQLPFVIDVRMRIDGVLGLSQFLEDAHPIAS
jgi:hypothetical protein